MTIPPPETRWTYFLANPPTRASKRAESGRERPRKRERERTSSRLSAAVVFTHAGTPLLDWTNLSREKSIVVQHEDVRSEIEQQQEQPASCAPVAGHVGCARLGRRAD